MESRRQFRLEERNQFIVRSHTSESDISEDIASEESSKQVNLTDLLDKNPQKLIKMEVNLNSQRRENDFYIYDKKVPAGVKITEHTLVFARKKLQREDVRVQVNPLRLPSKLIFFEYECKF